ncbi:hypothetical protein Hanom_Chr17g01577631 [Helianthus anomalus]
MCTSIRPGLSNAGSSRSLWFVVNIMIRSSPQHDHNPSMKFKSPDKENCKNIDIFKQIYKTIKA